MTVPIRLASLAGLAVASACIFLIGPTGVQADVHIYNFDAVPSSKSLQAGAHPDVGFTFELGNRMQTTPNPCNCEDPRDIVIHLPPGLVGNPHSTPQCTIAQFSTTSCPPDSQIGITEDEFSTGPASFTGGFIAPVYNLVPPPDQPGLLAFESVIGTPVFLNIGARTNSDYGVDTTISDINHVLPLQYSQTVIWGVPAAAVHDRLRFGLGEVPPLIGLQTLPFFCSETETPATSDPSTVYQICATGLGGPGPEGYGKVWPGGAIGECTELNGGCGGPGYPVVSNSPEIPFFQNPTTCGDVLSTSLDVLSYDGLASHADSPYPQTTDCNQLSFNPSQSIDPTTTATDSPSGAEFRLTVPQFQSPSVPSPSELKAAVVTLPSGFSFAPNVTNGKETCSDAQARFGTTVEAKCPENSKIGTLTVETPVLPGLLHGAVYLGEPKPGNRFRLILTFDGFGVHVKLPGVSTPDPTTGQIVIAFRDLPQVPFAEFNMHIFGAERGPLATPTQCGTYEVSSEWTPWASVLSNQVSRQFFVIDQGPDGRPCPNGARPFAPRFQAASASNTAAARTTFSLNLNRDDGDQNLAALAISTPPGFAVSLKNVSYCPEAAINASSAPGHTGLAEQAATSCPASSQVGEVIAAAGPGSHPLYVPGKVYLAGPYEGAPFSFVFITPAVSGGYDLGNIVVREGVRVDPVTVQGSTLGGQLPRIFEGIPLRLRQILVNLNRPGFVVNPTNCDPLSIAAGVHGDEGAFSTLSQHFQVANCADLPFQPQLALKLTGGLGRRGHPAIRAVFDTSPGEANTSRVSVTLPEGELLDNSHIGTVCTRVAFAAQSCPSSSRIGRATVRTPLLDQPLTGNAYLRSSVHDLPDIAVDLRGQIPVELAFRVDSVNGRLRTTLETAPDAPIDSFVLDLFGGSKGLLQNSESLCGSRKAASVTMRGQNGKRLRRRVRLDAACAKAGRKGRQHQATRPTRGGEDR